MSGRQKHYFTYANSARGFQNLLQTNLALVNKLYIINGEADYAISYVIERLAELLKEEGIDYIHSCFEPDLLDGIILPQKGIGIVNGMPPRSLDFNFTDDVLEYVDLSLALDDEVLSGLTLEIKTLKVKINTCYDEAYEEFAKAIKVHDEWEQVYIKNMDFSKANILTEYVIEELLGNMKEKGQGSSKHRFFGGATYKGSMDFVEELTEQLQKRYFIKGRPGSGKSTMLKKILGRAEQLSLEVEVYHCGFDPNSLDMLLFPTLDFCIFDSTAPHEYYPSRDQDTIIDMYEELIKPGTDEEFEEALQDIKGRYKVHVNTGIAHLAKAKSLQETIDEYYAKATYIKVLDEIVDELIYAISES